MQFRLFVSRCQTPVLGVSQSRLCVCITAVAQLTLDWIDPSQGKSSTQQAETNNSCRLIFSTARRAIAARSHRKSDRRSTNHILYIMKSLPQTPDRPSCGAAMLYNSLFFFLGIFSCYMQWSIFLRLEIYSSNMQRCVFVFRIIYNYSPSFSLILFERCFVLANVLPRYCTNVAYVSFESYSWAT